MAIVKRESKSRIRYQVRILGHDRNWIDGGTYQTRAEAELCEAKMKIEKASGKLTTNFNKRLTIRDYFFQWFEETKSSNISEGWRSSQFQMFRDYVDKQIGDVALSKVTPMIINRALRRMVDLRRSQQMQLHVYNLLHKMFEDAIEMFEVLETNPVHKRLKPKLVEKEAKYLRADESKKLLQWVQGKPYETAIWIQLYIGRRVGEVQALKWCNVDFDRNKIHIRATYRRKEKTISDYPKGRKWHSIDMPSELRDLLLRKRQQQNSEYVANSPQSEFLSYDGYSKALKRYCSEVGVTVVSTHGLRHSTAELWQAYGASKDDIQRLMAHSSSRVTDRYIHGGEGRLGIVASNIRLFETENSSVSQNVSQIRLVRGGL